MTLQRTQRNSAHSAVQEAGLGSVRQLADPAGEVVRAQGYTPFGVPLWSNVLGDKCPRGLGEYIDSRDRVSEWNVLHGFFARGVGEFGKGALLGVGGVYRSRMLCHVDVYENCSLVTVREEYDARGLHPHDATLAGVRVDRRFAVFTDKREYGWFSLGNVSAGQQGTATGTTVSVDSSNGRPKRAIMDLLMWAANSLGRPGFKQYRLDLL